MEPVLRITGALLVLGAITLFVGAPRPALIDHSFAGPITHRGKPVDFAKDLAEKKPELVLLGNSILDRAVDEQAFEDLIGRPCLKIVHGGAATALWYVILKNVIARAEPVPRTVAIFFRTVYLTEPAFRARAQFKPIIDYYADGEEPELDRIAYFEQMDPLTFTLNRFWSLYQRRESLRRQTEDVFKAGLVGKLSGLTTPEVRSAVDAAFAEEKMKDEQVDDGPSDPWLDLLPLQQFDFDAQVTRSFLPLIIEIARENGISLIFVRMRTRLDARLDAPAKPSIEARGGFIRSHLPQYIQSLRQYLEANGAHLLDLSGDERLQSSHFYRGDHLRKRGQALFMPYLAERLEPLLPAT